jgi:hypothetical protein
MIRVGGYYAEEVKGGVLSSKDNSKGILETL